MMRRMSAMAAACAVAITIEAHSIRVNHPDHTETSGDSIQTAQTHALQELTVSAVRAPQGAPFATCNIDSASLSQFSRTARELPFLLAQTPGVIAWTENGIGTGTSYLRIRGAGDSRINITIDGMPLNSPEDQCVFWANMNSYATLLGSIQIQRGIGTSTNGDGAFGGTVSLTTREPQQTAGGSLTGMYGSYGTWHTGGRFSSGLIANHLTVEGAYNETHTDGFVHGTAGRSGSYFGGLTWTSDRLTIRYKNIGNFETTGQAWNGVIAGDYDGNVLWDNPVPALTTMSYSDLYRAGYGRWNALCENIEYDWAGGMTAQPYIMKDGSRWEKTTDHFWQNHNILSATWKANAHWAMTAALRYTYGQGYYREFKYNNKLSKYGIPNLTLQDGTTLKRTDFVRKKGLTQNTTGMALSSNYTDRRWDVIFGFNAQHFTGNHYGHLTYMGNDELEALYLTDGKYLYYDSDARKTDLSAYAKATFRISTQWSAFADVQYRHVAYSTDGYNDKYQSDLSKNILDIHKRYDFLNPKCGLTWTSGAHRLYASIAMSHREPERNNFTDNASYGAPKAERLTDYEAGYSFSTRRWKAGINIYYMDYRDQFVQTGALSDIGEALTTNISRSSRMGMEIEASADITPWLAISGNMAWSRNRLSDFDEIITEVYDASQNSLPSQTIHYDSTPLAYSPSFIGNIFATFHWQALTATWHTNYVSRQYADNSGSRERSVPAYTVSNLSAAYTLTPHKRFCGIRNIEFGCTVSNLFNRHYAASGFVWYQYIADGKRLSQMSYIPSAGTTVSANITLNF